MPKSDEKNEENNEKNEIQLKNEPKSEHKMWVKKGKTHDKLLVSQQKLSKFWKV